MVSQHNPSFTVSLPNAVLNALDHLTEAFFPFAWGSTVLALSNPDIIFFFCVLSELPAPSHGSKAVEVEWFVVGSKEHVMLIKILSSYKKWFPVGSFWNATIDEQPTHSKGVKSKLSTVG